MSRDLKRRVAALGSADEGLTFGELLDLLQRQQAGEDIDFSKIKIEPKLADLLSSFR